jgi:hypothetical protein
MLGVGTLWVCCFVILIGLVESRGFVTPHADDLPKTTPINEHHVEIRIRGRF